MNNKRMLWIDSIKGFLMLLVIWSHSKAYIDKPGYFLTAGYMGVFFFLTGYTTLEWDINGIKYIKKKAYRLLIPYIVYGTLITLFQIAVSIFERTFNIYVIMRGILGFIYNAYTFDKESNFVFLIWDNGPFWFLTAMFLACVYAWVFFSLWNKKKKVIAISLLMIMSVLLNCNTRYMLPWGMDSAFIGAILIILGSFYRKYASKYRFTNTKSVLVVIILSALLLLLTQYKGVNIAVKEYGQFSLIGILMYLLISIVSSVLLLFIFSNSKEQSFLMKGFAFIGKITITLLCTQMIIIKVSNKIMFSMTENMIWAGWVSIIMTLLCGWLLNLCLRKLKRERFNWIKYL